MDWKSSLFFLHAPNVHRDFYFPLQIEDANFFVNAAVAAGAAATGSCKSPSSVNSGGNAASAVIGGHAPTEVTTDLFVFPNVSVTTAAEVKTDSKEITIVKKYTTNKKSTILL